MSTRFQSGDGTIPRARQLRRDATPAEQLLWSRLRSGQLTGAKFRRQQRIGRYFTDFACQAARLVIEIDGDTHTTQEPYDERRTAFLRREGYRVIRFTNADVLGNTDGVLTAILQTLTLPLGDAERAPPSPPRGEGPPIPLPSGEREGAAQRRKGEGTTAGAKP